MEEEEQEEEGQVKPTGESLEESVELDIGVLLVVDDLDEDVDAAVDDG